MSFQPFITNLIRIISLAALGLLAPAARASTIFVGTLSYDTFIPPGNGTPGVDAFDIANLTGGFSLPPDFPVTDSLTFEAAVLTLTLSDASQQVFDLGDIGPGFLLDMSGNPVVQVSSDESFTSAELTATLSPTTFMLFDGTTFTADSAALDVLLLPSVGSTLTVDVDQTTIDVSSPPAAAIPEPSGSALVLTGCFGLFLWSRRGARTRLGAHHELPAFNFPFSCRAFARRRAGWQAAKQPRGSHADCDHLAKRRRAGRYQHLGDGLEFPIGHDSGPEGHRKSQAGGRRLDRDDSGHDGCDRGRNDAPGFLHDPVLRQRFCADGLHRVARGRYVFQRGFCQFQYGIAHD